MPANVTELLQELIRIPSVNPDGDPGTDGVGEQALAEYLAVFLKKLGAEVEMHEVQPGRPNVVGRFPAKASGRPKLLFAPHTDTVSVGGMTIDPFGGVVRNKRVWGRGASDTKGSIAAMLWALKESKSLLPKLPWEIWFAGLMGEEAGQPGAKALAKRMRFDFVIAGEPTELQIVNTTKGCAWVTLRTAGRAVHASAPDLGDNAIYAMADVIRCLRDEIAPSLKALRYPVLGSPTMSVGTVRGGTKANIVPDSCEVVVDFRTIPGQELGPIFTRLRKASPGIGISHTISKPLFTAPYHPSILALQECGARCVGAPWFCDAGVFSEARMPAVALGPGSIAQAHTKDEYISIADLEAGVKFFKRFLRELAAD